MICTTHTNTNTKRTALSIPVRAHHAIYRRLNAINDLENTQWPLHKDVRRPFAIATATLFYVFGDRRIVNLFHQARRQPLINNKISDFTLPAAGPHTAPVQYECDFQFVRMRVPTDKLCAL